MFVTIITNHRGDSQILQVEAPTVKDCLVAWAGRVAIEGLTDEARTRLRGEMADFEVPDRSTFENTWKLTTDLGLDEPAEATVIVVATVRR